jgi:antitoxin VapB
MPLYVRDDDVRRLADELAQRRGCNVTEAVRSALNDALDREGALLAGRQRNIRRILARFDAAVQVRPGLTDHGLYDETGTPVL